MALPSEETVPKILCINATYFPDIVNDKISTENFLHASRGVVVIVEKFGKLFAPVKHDMEGNIEKLNNKYSIDKEKHKTLQDMILLEKEKGETIIATDALMWLKRSLYMILLFFEKLIEDHNAGKATDDLVAFLKEAYKISLEPYHGWMLQQLFGLLSRTVPSRKQLLQTIVDGKDFTDEIILRDMEIYTKNLRLNIENLQIFYKKYELEKDL
ncbi:pleckstrin homology domain-containing family A member 8-like isoform X1 [Vespa mandarinia]|uniref:pleckstrin homology domain-containing family A member 8-like isoform X1 n=1 Tax=Vespa mandarinia TaxID=7446 RepID=UPI00160ED505|nr:pleckstrin homology domain-containing family A member 8-like isoform X1 [Vespa mandarinia]